jgi:hypothetical protein
MLSAEPSDSATCGSDLRFALVLGQPVGGDQHIRARRGASQVAIAKDPNALMMLICS